MSLEVIVKLKNNPLFIKYLHENSYWYKILSRDPFMFDKFTEEVRKNYKLRATDKINDALSTFEMITSIFTTLK
jgi:hypothetical protein